MMKSGMRDLTEGSVGKNILRFAMPMLVGNMFQQLYTFVDQIIVGRFLGKEALGGFLAGAIFVGVVFGLFMANSGGLWDNAKKYIEDGALGGPGSEEHKAAVVGDTVGDPFKDTAGPSINTLLTVVALIATVFAPFVAQYSLPAVFGWF